MSRLFFLVAMFLTFTTSIYASDLLCEVKHQKITNNDEIRQDQDVWGFLKVSDIDLDLTGHKVQIQKVGSDGAEVVLERDSLSSNLIHAFSLYKDSGWVKISWKLVVKEDNSFSYEMITSSPDKVYKVTTTGICHL